MFRSPKDNWSRFLLWIDTVGGYWVCSGEHVVLGQPRPVDEPEGRGPDVPILANLSRRHARLHRDGEEFLLEPIRPTWVNDQAATGPVTLHDGDAIRLGEGCRLQFRQPHPLSISARLELVSRHRTEPSVRAVLLLAGACVLGPKADSHVVCRDWPQEVLLSLQSKELRCRGPAGIEVDGKPTGSGRATLHDGSQIRAEGISFSVEQLREA